MTSYFLQNLMHPTVFWIYLVLYLCLSMQIFISLLLLGSRFIRIGNISDHVTHISEWTINVPPSFGVLGTIVSMASAIAAQTLELDNNTFTQIFMENFSAAVGTTIVGGIVYALNLFLFGLTASLSEDQK